MSRLRVLPKPLALLAALGWVFLFPAVSQTQNYATQNGPNALKFGATITGGGFGGFQGFSGGGGFGGGFGGGGFGGGFGGGGFGGGFQGFGGGGGFQGFGG